mgnify:CR=1 FL=1
MKITKKILENIIKEEINKILKEDDNTPPGPKDIDVLEMDKTMPRPSAQQFKNEPVATYVLQRLDAYLTRIEARIEKLEGKL